METKQRIDRPDRGPGPPANIANSGGINVVLMIRHEPSGDNGSAAVDRGSQCRYLLMIEVSIPFSIDREYR